MSEFEAKVARRLLTVFWVLTFMFIAIFAFQWVGDTKHEWLEQRVKALEMYQQCG